MAEQVVFKTANPFKRVRHLIKVHLHLRIFGSVNDGDAYGGRRYVGSSGGTTTKSFVSSDRRSFSRLFSKFSKKK